MNSFHGVEKALRYEIERQSKILDNSSRVLQQTLLWDENTNTVKVMRTKEESDDYRYFPKPDLVPLVVDEKWIEEVKNGLPELPGEKYTRFLKQYNLRPYDSNIIASDFKLADYFEAVVKIVKDSSLSSKWIQSEVLRVLKDKNIDISQFTIFPDRMGELLKIIKEKVVTASVGKEVFNRMLGISDYPREIIEREGLAQISDESELESVVESVIQENPDKVEKYKAGKKALFGFFMGQVMKCTKCKANPGKISKILKKLLEKKKDDN